MFYPSILGIFLIPAIAWAEPVVDPAVLERIPEEERLSWAPLEIELARIDAELVGARAQLGEALALADDGGAAEGAAGEGEVQEDRPTGGAAWSAVDIAETRLELAQDELATAEQTVEVRRAELELARQQGDRSEVSAAREALKGAKRQRSVRKDDLRVAQDDLQDVQREEGDLEPEEGVASTPIGRSGASDIGAVLDNRVEVARARVQALEARRERVKAELERERAQVANEHGASLDLAPFEQAVEDARKAEVAAADRLSELEAGAPGEMPDPSEL